jgi:2-dehydro-3-deoxyphosphogluconate aldolase / (4S)-4-hydroxy-2-oxoglutarate aldolase
MKGTAAETLAALHGLGVIPIMRIDRAEDAVPVGKALLEGGLPCAEITFRTPAAAEGIARMAVAYPELLLGAGTVLTLEQAETAIRAGARYLIAPGFDPELADFCQVRDIAVLPGVATATEITMAVKRGLRVLKYFPTEVLGGIAMLKALSGPFVGVQFAPTGGINAKNLADYLALPCVFGCGGSWMVEGKLIAAGQWGEITRLAAEARAIVRQVRGE